jgi:tRNA threonylcarbamoyladenosine biosynthesis protein TsaE
MSRLQIESNSSEETKRIAESIGANLKGGEVIELISDLGGGKTIFTIGLAKGMGYEGNVRSPSFTIMHEYETEKLTLYHFDFYRLNEPGIISAELAELIGNQKAVIVVEWSDIVNKVLPENIVKIKIKVTALNDRQLIIEYPDELSYLIPKDLL